MRRCLGGREWKMGESSISILYIFCVCSFTKVWYIEGHVISALGALTLDMRCQHTAAPARIPETIMFITRFGSLGMFVD
jgi:hypothetical protein